MLSSPPLLVASVAARMVLWVMLLGGALPALLVRRRPRGRVAYIAGVALLAIVGSAVLWLAGRLERGLFLLALGVWLVFVNAEVGPGFIKSRVQRAWVSFADAFFDPDAPNGVVRSARGNEAAGDDAALEHPRARQDFAGIFQRVRARIAAAWATRNEPGGGLAALVVWTATPRWRAQVTLIVAAIAGVAVAVVRARGASPVDAVELEALLRREHLEPWRGSWLPDSTLVKLAERLAVALPWTASVAIAAPMVLVAAWSAMAVARKLAPGMAPWIGALAGSVFLARALALGHPCAPSLMAGLFVPWGCALGAGGLRRGSGVALVALGLLSPAAGIAACVGVVASAVFRRSRSVARAWARIVLVIAGTIAASCLAAWTSDVPAASVLPRALSDGAPTLSTWAAALGAVASLWLVLAPRRGWSKTPACASRGLGLVTLAAIATSGVLGRAYVTLPPFTTSLLVSLTAAVVLQDFARASRSDRDDPAPRWPTELASLGAIAVIAGLALEVAPPEPHAPSQTLAAGATAASAAVWDRHMAWEVTIVGTRDVLPAFVGMTWFVEGPQALAEYERELTRPAASRASLVESIDAPFARGPIYIVIGEGADASSVRAFKDALVARGERTCLVGSWPSAGGGAVELFAVDDACTAGAVTVANDDARDQVRERTYAAKSSIHGGSIQWLEGTEARGGE